MVTVATYTQNSGAYNSEATDPTDICLLFHCVESKRFEASTGGLKMINVACMMCFSDFMQLRINRDHKDL